MNTFSFSPLAVAALATFSASIAAALPCPAASAAAAPTFTVVMKGLNNPRHLNFDSSGSLYVAESGTGGGKNAVSYTGNGGDTQYFGATGSVSELIHGRQSRVIAGLPSSAAADGTGATGPSDVVVVGGVPYVLIGSSAFPNVRGSVAQDNPLIREFGTLMAFPSPGAYSGVSLYDFEAHEAAYNPDGADVNSNPYALALLPGSHGASLGFPGLTTQNEFVVADAGGNDVFVAPALGLPTLAAVLPTLPATIPNGPTIQAQSVATSLAVSKTGVIYAGELTGYPFPQGGASVYRVSPGVPPAEVATGFTNIIDLKFGPDGALYVLDLTTSGGQGFPAQSGSSELYKVDLSSSTPTKTLLVSSGLFAATGVAIDKSGAVYLSTNGILPGAGQVVRVNF